MRLGIAAGLWLMQAAIEKGALALDKKWPRWATRPSPRGRRGRAVRRHIKQGSYFAHGLNGPRQMARRNRQRNRVELRAKVRAFAQVLCLPDAELPQPRAQIVERFRELQAAYVANAPHKWQREQVAA